MKINGDWKILDSKEIYKNHWMKVIEDKVVRPNGKDGIFGIVEARNGVSILPIGEDGYVYLTEQFRYTMEKNSVEAVSGGIEDNEKPLDTAKRELKEELGIKAEEWIDMGVIDPLSTIIKSPHSIFLARKLKFGKDCQDGSENIKMVKMKLKDAIDMVIDSTITHGPSCVLILKANEYLINKKWKQRNF